MVRCEGLVQVYGLPGQEVTALRGVDLAVDEAETVALLGPSGAGKSTLLWLFAGLLRPTAGIVEVCGRRLSDLTPKTGAEMRLRDVGVVMQNPGRNLLPYETAIGNLLLAQSPTRRTWPVKRRRSAALLDSVGLARVAHRPAGRLSGGEQQRLALARALITQPQILLADEPTGDLDGRTAEVVFELVARLHREHQLTSLIATHNLAFARRCHRVLRLNQGRMEEVAPESLSA
jgi:lipoprotein-releasing system ATP-binding protein